MFSIEQAKPLTFIFQGMNEDLYGWTVFYMYVFTLFNSQNAFGLLSI